MMINKNSQMGIYIHIPFCVQKCEYCDFLSFSSTPDLKKDYVRALLEEIKIMGSIYAGIHVSSLFIGGGTPTTLESHQLEEILSALRHSFYIKEGAEFSVECNPGTIDEKKAEVLRSGGANRISLGLQSADNRELKALGRIHTYETFLESYGLLRSKGFANINVDLMSALPWQKEEDWTETLNKIAKLRPEHISAYSLMVEEGTPLSRKIRTEKQKGIESLPDEECERNMYSKTREILAAFGYVQYEVSNFALPGFECIHNVSYWTRKNYLGIGLGASSLINEVRYKNTEDVEHYLKNSGRPDEIQTEKICLSENDQMSEYMFLGLRMTKGVSVKEFYQNFGKSFEEIYGDITVRMEKAGLVFRNGDWIALTLRGIDLSNMVMSSYLL